MRRFKQITLENKLFRKIFITTLLTVSMLITMKTSVFAATLHFTDGVHNGTSVTIGDDWVAESPTIKGITPRDGIGSTTINGLSVPYFMRHTWKDGGTGMNHYAHFAYPGDLDPDVAEGEKYKSWYWYIDPTNTTGTTDGDKIILDDKTSYTATLHTNRFANGVKYYTNTSISNASSGTLGANEFGGRNVTLPSQSMKTCYVRFNGNGGTASSSYTSYNYSFSKYKCSTSSKYPIYTNVANGGDYGTGTSVIVPIATSWDDDNLTATLSFTSYYNRPEISLATASRPGYIFNGWNTRADGQGTAYSSKISANSNITSPDISTDLTLYAQWIPITYTVVFNGNGATSGSTSSVTHTYNAQNNLSYNGFERKYTITFNGNGGTTPVSKTSTYAFYRWRQYANATGWSFTNGQTNVGNLSSSNGATVTLYAQWSPESIKLPNTSRNAYSFAGWYYGTSRIGGVGDNYTPNSNIELMAKWNLITKSISGTISWEDENNKYNSRPKNASRIETVDVTLNSDETITEIASGALTMPNTQTVVGENYTFNNLQKNKIADNTEYIYTVTQNVIPGYETIINGYNITNKLILPKYNSSITYTPINSFENRYLKNGKVKITGEVTAQSDNRSEVGLNQGKAIFNIDSGITIDTSKIVVNYYNAETNTTSKLTNYTISGNTITAIFGKDSNGISKKGDKITIETEGTLTKLGEYSSNIIATGNLRDYRGANTNIDLGQVTNTTKNINVDYQLPRANIKIQKIDSITKEKLTDATFTLYEWDGEKYIQKEIITDENKDGIYESNYYEWNVTTNGKYKVVETGIPEKHKDLKFSMEYKLNQLKTENYTVKPDYSNSEYQISYGVRNPDEFTSTDGIVENEPWKLKAKIEKVDIQTHNTIQSEAQFTIYEWNQTNNSYELFVSEATGKEVKMVRQSDKTYVSGEWLYYTQNNKGKYRIIETKAPQGYYANYNQTKQKVTYDIDVKDIIDTGKFENQSINNEGTIFISNNNDLTLTNKRQKARLNITVVDKETQAQAQADAVLQDAKYGIYALENIYHADGVTTRYSETPGLLYKKDELIQTAITDKEGKFLFENLECGKYYIKMIQAPEGYLLDESIYTLDFSYQGEAVEIIEGSGVIGIKVKKQAFQMYKIKENSTVLNNAGFSIYLVNDLSIVKEGKIRKVTTERYELIDTKAQKDERIKQRQNADGTYYLKDLIDYYYKIMYDEGNEQVLPGDNKVYHPYNLSTETLVKDYSNLTQGETIQEIRTNDKGYLKSPELAYGEYVAIETSVPRKQDAASPIVVKVEEDSRTLQDLRFVKDDNFRTKVKIYIRDVQTSKTILNKNIKYIIRNIDTQEYMTQKIWVPNEGYVEYGTPDKPFEAQKTGFIITPMKLEVGQYELIEITAGEGYTTNKFEGTSVNGQTQFNSRDNIRFEIRTNTAYYTDTYLGSYIIVVNETNKSVVGDITIKTQGEYLSNIISDENQNHSFEYANRNVSNAKYQIIAKEDIYTQDNQGQKIYSKDEVVGYITTDEKGEGIIENLPLGKYIIKQVECPESFTLNTNDKEVEIDYQGQEIPVVFKNVEQEQIRQKIEILIHNKDEEEENVNRQGGKYGLYTKEEIRYTDKNGNVKIIPANTLLQTVTSNENGEIKFNSQENIDLPQGKYYVKEIEAPEGYVLQETKVDIDTIRDNQKQAILKIEKDLMGQKTNVKVQDVNEEEQLVTGSKLQIIEKDTGKVIETWQTEAQIKTFRKLKVNTKYIVKQIEPARGYVTAEEIEFIIKTNGKIEINGQEQEENIINIISRQTKLDIILKDEIDSSYVSGVKFKILDKNTNEEIITFVTPAGPQRVLGLPIGNYILKEIEIPNLGYVTINDVDFEVKDTKDIQQLEITQSVSKLEVHIFDELENEKYVEGTKWQIVDKETEEVKDEWVQDGNKHEVKKLPIGNYILKEVEVPSESGYVTIEDVEFTIKDTLEVQQVKVTQSVSKLEVHIFDELENEKYVEGTKWQIVDKETEEVKDEWVQDGNKHEVKKLPIGNYILKEVEVPSESGYVTIEDVEFEVKDTLEVQSVTVTQAISKVSIIVYDKQTKEDITSKISLNIVNKETKQVVATTKEIKQEENNTKEEQSNVISNEIANEVVNSNSNEVVNEEINSNTNETIGNDGTNENETSKNDKVLQIKQTENGYYVEKLPIGEYTIVETKIPVEEGFVEYQEIDMSVEDTLEIQKTEIYQDITKVLINVIDEETKELIEDANLQILDKETKQIIAQTKEEINDDKNDTTNEEETKEDKTLEIKKTKDGYYLERLPIGEYILIQQTKEGYHEIEQKEIKIENTKEIQKFEIVNIRLKYDMKVEKQLEKITFDGEETLINNSDVRKIEIRERKISTANVKLQYVIKVSNVGETDAKVGTIIDKIPEGFTLVPEESNGWIMNKNLATYKAYEDETIKPGETKQVSITVKWKNSVTNFGEKINTAMVVNSSNPYGYEDKNKENDEGKSLVVISVGTGIETAVTAARIIMVAFIGSMTVCLVAAIELMIKQKRKE